MSMKPLKGPVRFRVCVARVGEARGLTHLGQIEALRRAVVESGLPALTDGKRRRPRLAFGPAISMGWESLAEYFDLELSSALSAEAVGEALAKTLKSGFALQGARRIPAFFPSLDSTINVASYEIEAPFPDDAPRRLDEFLARREIVVEKVKEAGVERVDARPLIVRMKLDGPGRLGLVLRFGPKRTVKPEALLREWLGALPEGALIRRNGLYSETAAGELMTP
jgi:radical SAM-linked protein